MMMVRALIGHKLWVQGLAEYLQGRKDCLYINSAKFYKSSEMNKAIFICKYSNFDSVFEVPFFIIL